MEKYLDASSRAPEHRQRKRRRRNDTEEEADCYGAYYAYYQALQQANGDFEAVAAQAQAAPAAAAVEPAKGSGSGGGVELADRQRGAAPGSWQPAVMQQEGGPAAAAVQQQAGPDGSEPWQAAVKQGRYFEIPVYPEPAAAASVAAAPQPAQPDWRFPTSPADKRRYAVFRDLHSRGCAAADAEPPCPMLLSRAQAPRVGIISA